MLTAAGLVAVVALIAANGWFVAVEFSYVAARRGRLDEAATRGDARGARAVAVHRRLSFMLSGAQLGITVTSLVVGFIARPTLGAALEPVVGAVGVPDAAQAGIALTVGFALATAAQMVFGELAPKNLAIARPEPVALRTARATVVYLAVAGPVIRLFDGAANRLLRAVGVEPVTELHGSVAADELPLIVDASSEAGSLTASQGELLSRALDFRDLDAREVMVPWSRVATVAVDARGRALLDLLDATSHMRFPVVDDRDEVVGVVHSKDLLGVAAPDRADVAVSDLAREVLAVPESAGLHRVLAELRSASASLAVVVDEHGATAGILTLEDVVEELFGAIDDEYDRAGEGGEAVVLGPSWWRVPGTWRLHEVERATGVELPEGPYDTVAGYVMDRLGRLPAPGDQVWADGLIVTVGAMDRWVVRHVDIEIAPTDEDGRR